MRLERGQLISERMEWGKAALGYFSECLSLATNRLAKVADYMERCFNSVGTQC